MIHLSSVLFLISLLNAQRGRWGLKENWWLYLAPYYSFMPQCLCKNFHSVWNILFLIFQDNCSFLFKFTSSQKPPVSLAKHKCLIHSQCYQDTSGKPPLALASVAWTLVWASATSSPLPPPLDAEVKLFSSTTVEYAPTHGRYSINESWGERGEQAKRKTLKIL